MKTIQFLIIISLITFGLFACQDTTTKDKTTKETEVVVAPPEENTEEPAAPKEVEETNNTEEEGTSTDTSTTEEPKQTDGVAEIEKPKDVEVKPVNPVVDPTYEKYTAGLSEARMSLALEAIAQSIEGQKLKYDRTIGQDCSGIYHRIKDSIQARFPALARDYQFPQFNTDRNTRQIAHWYHKNGNLHFVQDALADQNRLRPGSVLFFGRTDEKYDKVDIDLLSNANVFQHDATAGKGKIYHIAVVTAVRDDNGKKRVTIMHGRNKKHAASRTEVNYDGPGGFKKKFAQFPFGNWNQQLVAIANIATPK